MVAESNFRARAKRMNMDDTWGNGISLCLYNCCKLGIFGMRIVVFPASCRETVPRRTFDYGNTIRFEIDCFQDDTLQGSELRIDPQISTSLRSAPSSERNGSNQIPSISHAGDISAP